MRLIDADKLVALLNKKYGDDDINESVLYLVGAISGAPTVDPVKHGKWTVTPIYIKCSECGDSFPIIPQNYCPNCGAKMDEVEDADT